MFFLKNTLLYMFFSVSPDTLNYLTQIENEIAWYNNLKI